jgi:flagellar hook-associated protein 1 FlgK
MDPNAPYDLNYSNTGGFEIFVRKNVPRFNDDGTFNPERSPYTAPDGRVINPPHTLYTIGNIEVNPLLLDASGYNYIALMTAKSPADVPEGPSDNQTVLNILLKNWKDKFISIRGGEPMTVDDAYRHFVATVATETRESIDFADQQMGLLVQVDNKRSSLSGVSLDEEMRNMLIYQHAYNASARMVNVIDNMIDRVVNHTGRVGR